jgi:Outer membrane protein beta-barrel domain
MKTLKLLPILVLIIATTKVQAQYYPNNTSDERDILQFGIKGGVNNSNLYDVQGQDFVANPIFGPVAGCFLSIPFSKYLGIQPEVLYSVKGYAGSGTLGSGQTVNAAVTTVPPIVKGNPTEAVTTAGSGDPQNYSFVDRMNFIDVPVMLQIKPLPTLYILAGPEYSYLLSRTYTFTQGVTTEMTQQQFQNDNLRHNIFGFISGIDLNLNRNWTIGGRVAWDMQDGNGDGTSALPSYRNFWGQVALGFRL